MKMTDDDFVKYFGIWNSSYFFGRAIIEDYATRMAKLEGTSRQKIIDTINIIAAKRSEEFYAENKKQVLPEQIKKTLEVKITYAIAACIKLSIPFDPISFDLSEALTTIEAKSASMYSALKEYFDTYSSYRFSYLSLKKHGRGYFSTYQARETEMNAKKAVLDLLLK